MSEVDLSRYSKEELKIIAGREHYHGRSLTQEEINLGLEQARAIFGDDLSTMPEYSKEELSIVNLMQRDQDHPLTQEQINLGLHQARAIHGEDLKG